MMVEILQTNHSYIQIGKKAFVLPQPQFPTNWIKFSPQIPKQSSVEGVAELL